VVISPDLLCLAGNHEVLVRIWRWRRAWHPRHITVLVVFKGRDGCAAMCLPAFCSLSYFPCAYLDTEPLISLHQRQHPRGHQHWVHRLQVDYPNTEISITKVVIFGSNAFLLSFEFSWTVAVFSTRLESCLWCATEFS
jgi:hypothetical protein